jgi:hypothetical protein
MKHNGNINWLDDALAKYLKNKTDEFDFQQWQAKFPGEARLLRQRCQAKEKMKTTSWSLFWRTIMKSPYTKYGTVAAGIFIAVLFLFPSGNGSDSIAWADVQQTILDQQNCMMIGTRILSTHHEQPQVINYTVHKYISREYGYVDQTFDEEGNLFIQLTVHHPSNIVTVLFPKAKRYIQIPVTQKYQEKMEEITPLELFKALFLSDSDRESAESVDIEKLDLRSLDCLTESEIDGVPVFGFPITHLLDNIAKLGFENLDIFLGMRQISGYIWINPETLLPAQMDAEVELGKCILTNFQDMTLSEVNHFVEWNSEMDETMFLPEIPEDYKLFGMPEMKTTAVMGTSTIVAAIPLILWGKKRRKN